MAFLGLGRLLINVTRRFAYLPLVGCFLLHLVLLMIASGLPLVSHVAFSRGRFFATDSLLEITNPFLTLARFASRGPAPSDAPETAILVLAAACVALLLNFRSVARELQHHRVPLPERVAEEEAALRPAPVPAPSNPWEYDEPE